MRILYIATAGSTDKTAASLPILLAVASLEAGHTVEIALLGDATELARAAFRDKIQGHGIPPLSALFETARQHQVPVYVSQACAAARRVKDDDAASIGGRWVTPVDIARLIEAADRVVTL